MACHLRRTDSSSEIRCQSADFAGIQEDGDDRAAHQSDLGTDTDVSDFPDWFLS